MLDHIVLAMLVFIRRDNIVPNDLLDNNFGHTILVCSAMLHWHIRGRNNLLDNFGHHIDDLVNVAP